MPHSGFWGNRCFFNHFFLLKRVQTALDMLMILHVNQRKRDEIVFGPISEIEAKVSLPDHLHRVGICLLEVIVDTHDPLAIDFNFLFANCFGRDCLQFLEGPLVLLVVVSSEGHPSQSIV